MPITSVDPGEMYLVNYRSKLALVKSESKRLVLNNEHERSPTVTTNILSNETADLLTQMCPKLCRIRQRNLEDYTSKTFKNFRKIQNKHQGECTVGCKWTR